VTEPEERNEPPEERADPHEGPLDDDEDARYLQPDDPRRIAALRRLGGTFGPRD
jgi:hypothetical protein